MVGPGLLPLEHKTLLVVFHVRPSVKIFVVFVPIQPVVKSCAHIPLVFFFQPVECVLRIDAWIRRPFKKRNSSATAGPNTFDRADRITHAWGCADPPL